MTWDSLTYNGVDLYALCKLKMTKTPLFMPQLRERAIVVPRRSGSYKPKSHWHDDIEILLACTIDGDVTEDQMDDLKYVLSRRGRIVFFDRPDRYLMGQCFNAAQVVEYYRRCMQDFELVFKCDPYWYDKTPTERKTGEATMWFNTADTRYRGTREAPTRIIIRNTGTTPISGINLTMRKTVL